jgi:hypothetical protein
MIIPGYTFRTSARVRTLQLLTESPVVPRIFWLWCRFDFVSQVHLRREDLDSCLAVRNRRGDFQQCVMPEVWVHNQDPLGGGPHNAPDEANGLLMVP